MNIKVASFFLILMMLSTLSILAQDVKIVTEKKGDTIQVFAHNTSLYMQSVELNCELKGMKSTQELPIIQVVQPKTKVHFTDLIPIDIYKGYSFGTSVQFIQGDVTAEHDADFVYGLPYPKGKVYNVDQGYMGNRTHQGEYALDFNMDIGSEICAIRDGVVFKVVEKYDKGCGNESCNDFNNYVLLLHEDGSMADYSHLKKNGAKVKEGQTVKAGEVIALSGATGWASGPHLHLEVYIMSWTGQETIEAKYQLGSDKIGIPQQGESYQQTQ